MDDGVGVGVGVCSPVLMRLKSGVVCDTDEVESTRGRRLEEMEWWTLLSGESEEGLGGWEWALDCIPDCDCARTVSRVLAMVGLGVSDEGASKSTQVV